MIHDVRAALCWVCSIRTCAIAKAESEGCAAAAAVLGDSGGRMEAGAMAKGDSGPGAAAEAGVAVLRCTCVSGCEERCMLSTRMPVHAHARVLDSACATRVACSLHAH